MSNDFFILLYLLYGFTFILMGVYAVKAYQKSYSVFPLVSAMVFLGVFGIAHGISEWLTMFRFAGAFAEYDLEIFFLSRILKAISFLALIQFGFVLLLRPFWQKVGGSFLIVYFLAVISVLYGIIFNRGIDHLYENPAFLIITLRYMMALPGAILSMIVLFHHGLKIRKMDPLWMKFYIYLGISIMIYGMLDGLFVRKADFFPANFFYSQWFFETLGIPIQILKIISGIGIYIGMRLVIDSFSWEKKNTVITLKTQEAYLREKQHMNQMLHDELIQSLYMNGLKLAALQKDCDDAKSNAALGKAVVALNKNIETVRDFLKENLQPNRSIEDLDTAITEVIEDIFRDRKCEVAVINHLENQGLHIINKEILIQIYYIIQELLLNVVKHAKASRVKLIIYQEMNHIKLIIRDNGVGFDTTKTAKETSQGLKNVTDRVHSLKGVIQIQSNKTSALRKGKTIVTILIPIEAYHG